MLATMLQDRVAIALAVERYRITPDDFFLPAYRTICATIFAEFHADHPVDHITITEALRRQGQLQEAGGARRLKDLLHQRATLENVESYIKEILVSSTKRWATEESSRLHRMSNNGATPLQLRQFVDELTAGLAERTERIAATGVDPTRSRFKLIPFPDLESQSDPEFIIDGILVEGTLSCIVGPSATFKSFVAIGIAGCVSLGIPWYGRATKRGPVLYISGEGSGGIKRRRKAWGIANRQQWPKDCYLLPEAVQFLNPEHIDFLLHTIRGLPEPPRLVIVDTLARAMVGGDENATKDMGLFIAGADRIRQETGAHVLTIHHFNRENRICLLYTSPSPRDS